MSMNKKILLFIVICITIFLFIQFSRQIFSKIYNNKTNAIPLQTQTELQYNQKLSSITSDILKSQNITSLNQLDCKKIADSQLINIGGIFMDMMFGNEHVRKQIDDANGLQNATQAYLQIGKYYLECPNNWTSTFPSSQTQQQFGDAFNNKINNVLRIQNVTSLKQLNCKKL